MSKNKVIPDLNGSNITVNDVEKDRVKTHTYTVKVDDTPESVVELIEKFERVELIFPPKVFVELDTEKLKDKLTANSLMKYGVAKRDYEATQRDLEKDKVFPERKKLRITGGSVTHKMKFTEEEKEWARKNNKHLAILNDYEVDSAKESGYVDVPGAVPINNFIPASRRDERLYKMAVDLDDFKDYMQENSNVSRAAVKQQDKFINNSNLEVRQESEPTKIYE